MTRSTSYNDFTSEVVYLLRQFVSDSIDFTSFNRFVRLAARMVTGRLWRRLQASASAHGTMVEQEAMSCIADLFCYQPNGARLREALAGYAAAGDAGLFLRFRAVVLRTASRELFRRWKESDPVGARLWRNLRHALRRDSRLELIPTDRPEWIVVSGGGDRCGPIESIDFADIEKRIGPGEIGENDLPGLACAILTSMIRASGDRPAMLIDDFFHAVRKGVMRTAAEEMAQRQSLGEGDPLFGLVLEDIADEVKDETETGVDGYFARGRLDSKMAECFRQALGDFTDDILDSGTAMGYYQYLCGYDPELTWTEYRRELRGMFEYLAAGVKAMVKERLEREFAR